MKRLLRLLFPLIFIPTSIVTAIAAALFFLVPQSQWRGWLASEIGSHVHRQIEIGPLHLRWNGLTIDSLRISEIPTFKAGDVVDAKGVHIGWHLRGLWEGLNLRAGKMTRSSGSFRIDDFRNPHYVAKDFHVEWSLSGLEDPTHRITGSATLRQGPGRVKNLDQLMNQSKSARAALAPLLALMNLERSGVVRLGLPDLRNLPVDTIEGDYHFDRGVMTLRQFAIKSPALTAGTRGTVELASGKLALKTEIHTPATPRTGALDATLDISGTTANPVVDLSTLKKKMFKASVQDILSNPSKAKDALKSIFH